MAVFCPNCGTQNPETNRFCQNCGAQMPARAPAPVTTAAPPPAAPPAPAPSPPPPSWARPSPYYRPAQPPTMRRLPVGLIAGAIVGLLILMSGMAVVVAAVAKGTNNGPQPSPHATIGPTEGPSSNPTPGTPPPSLPSPTPTSPTAQGSVCTKTLCLTPAQGWTVKSKDDTSVVLTYDDLHGLVRFQAVRPPSPVQVMPELQRFVDSLKSQSPDAAVCQQAQDLTAGGVKGLYEIVCFTFTPQGGQALKLSQLIWIGINADGSAEYEFDATSPDSDLSNFVNVVNPLQHTVQWKV